jgi:hypothetical protein
MIGPRVRVAIAVAFFAYVLLIRTYDLANSFLMIGEQIRDWRVALGPWFELPLTGAPSTAGGRGLGPAYYWLLWLGRHLVGPFTDNLPHAGGIWVALLQSAADTWLLVVLMRRVHPALALAMSLLIASAPFDISISGVIWNPPVAAALVKMTTALALSLGAQPSHWRVAATAAMAWLALQTHLSAAFVAGPVLALLVAQPLLLRQWRRAAVVTGVVAATILVLQVPYLRARFADPAAAAGPTAALSSMAQAKSLYVARSYSAVVNTAGELLVRRREDAWMFQWPFVAVAAIVLWRWRQDLPLLAVSVGPIVAATVLFSTWSRAYDSYWFLTATTAMALTFGLAVAALPQAAAPWSGVVLLAGVLAWQPARVAAAKDFFAYPAYRSMRIGSRELARVAPVLRDIRITFEAHPTMDKYFIYTILGGRMDPAAPQRGFIDADGGVRVE